MMGGRVLGIMDRRCRFWLLQVALLVFLLVVNTAVASTSETDDSAPSHLPADDEDISIPHDDPVSQLVRAALRVAGAENPHDVFTKEEMELLTARDLDILTAAATPPCSSSSCDNGSEPENGAADEEGNVTEDTVPPPTCASTNTNEKIESDVDRRARLIVETAEDYDCMHREFDVSSPDFDVEDAARVFGKCRLVVLRNVYSKKQTKKFRKLSWDFVMGLQNGRVDPNSPMVNGNQKFFSERSKGKWEVLLPDYFLNYAVDFATEPVLRKLVQHPLVLGKKAIYTGSGVLLAEPESDGGHWHTDASYLLGEDSLAMHGLAGHDLPPHAINIATPLVNITMDSGPTEYCVGTSHLIGTLDRLEALQPDGAEDPRLLELVDASRNQCPARNWRVPTVNPGDLIMWDYLIRHRSGGNRTPKTRPLLFATYSREWYEDHNFAASGMFTVKSEDAAFLARRQQADVVDPYKAINDCDKKQKKKYLCKLEEDAEVASVTSVKRFFREEESEEDLTKRLFTGNDISFRLSNKDLTSARFILEGRKKAVVLSPGETRKLKTTAGAVLSLVVPDGRSENGGTKKRTLRSWRLRQGQRQIIVSRQSLEKELRELLAES